MNTPPPPDEYLTEKPFLVMVPMRVFAETEAQAVEHIEALLDLASTASGVPIDNIVHGGMVAIPLEDGS